MNTCKHCGGLGVRLEVYQEAVMCIDLTSKDFRIFQLENMVYGMSTTDLPPHHIEQRTKSRQYVCQCQEVKE